jgi:hypothetical protein
MTSQLSCGMVSTALGQPGAGPCSSSSFHFLDRQHQLAHQHIPTYPPTHQDVYCGYKVFILVSEIRPSSSSTVSQPTRTWIVSGQKSEPAIIDYRLRHACQLQRVSCPHAAPSLSVFGVVRRTAGHHLSSPTIAATAESTGPLRGIAFH